MRGHAVSPGLVQLADQHPAAREHRPTLRASTLTPGLTPDESGDYVVRFAACSSGCTVAIGDGASLTAEPFTREVKFTALDTLALPPDTEPIVPTRPAAPSLPLEAFFYAVRTLEPFAGSWGARSSAIERVPACASVDHVFTFRDRFQADLTSRGLGDYFATVRAAASDYIGFEMRDQDVANNRETAWCAERADWYVAEYLAHAGFGSTSFSGAWDKWSRDSMLGNHWTGPHPFAYPNHFGGNCQGLLSWCTESGLGGVPSRSVHPGAGCELSYPPWGGCTNDRWRLTIGIGPDRERVCGF